MSHKPPVAAGVGVAALPKSHRPILSVLMGRDAPDRATGILKNDFIIDACTL